MVELIEGRKYKIKREGWGNILFKGEILERQQVGNVYHYKVKITDPGLAAGTVWLEKEEILEADPIVGGGKRRKTHKKGRKSHKKGRKSHKKGRKTHKRH